MGERTAVMSWSGGKDCAVALWRLRSDPAVRVAALLTTVTEGYERISMHGVPRALLAAQAGALGMPLYEVRIPPQCPNTVYEERMGAMLERLRADGVDAVAFGDLFLEDVRAYRERALDGTGLAPLFPIWGEDTRALAHTAIDAGFRARICCVDPQQVPPALLGSDFDHAFLAALPAGTDPCGERGEFHTFVYAGPGFARPVAHVPGASVQRDGFWFRDLQPGEGAVGGPP